MDQPEYRDKFEGAARRIHYRMERRRHSRGGRIWTGLCLLIIGGLLLARQSGVNFPHWFFTWPVLLIALGLWIGARHRFRGFAWVIPIGIGALNLLGDFEDLRFLRPYVGPAVLIFLGLAFIFKPRRSKHWDDFDPEMPPPGPGFRPGGNRTAPFPEPAAGEPLDQSDRLDITAVCGGVKKNVLTKTFKGGEIVTFMGGAEINLTQADFDQQVRIDCTNVFGGTKLILPPDWEVQSDIVAVFGGVDDKRPPATNPAPGKVIVLDGTCFFGGVEIRSYY
ncbi:MAG: hypothetical protein EOO11_18375 [Chitinophagaceae bacterium]|nr:MAG: hypothetical protein EOO11_18375 [Chitinophagaceae bacterium]